MIQRRIPQAFRPLLLVSMLFAGISTCITRAGSDRAPELVRAIRDGQEKKINDLLKRKTELNAQDDYGWTPLMCAVLKKNIQLVDRLLSGGADPNLQDQDGVTPLVAAIIEMPQPFMVQYLPETEKASGIIALNLIEKGADLNKADKDGNTALMYAVIANQLSIVEALIIKGVDPNRPDIHGRTPLYFVSNPEKAAAWAPAEGALSVKYRLRGIPADESSFSPDYAAQVAKARAQANVMIDQIKARIAALLKNAGATAPDPGEMKADGDHLIDTRARRLGGMGARPLDQIIGNYLRAERKEARYDLLVRVAQDGTVKKVLVLSGAPNGVSEQLQKAALKLKYQPATKAGAPVEEWDRIIGGGRILERRSLF